MAVGVIHVSGTQASSGGGGGGTTAIEAGPGIIVDEGDPTFVSADFGTGNQKVLQATKAAIEACLSNLAGIVRMAGGVLFADSLSKEEMEAALGPLASGIVRSIGGILSSGALTKADLAPGGSAGQALTLDPSGSVMQWAAISPGVTWGGDLTGSSNTTQQVAALTKSDWIPVTTGLSFGSAVPALLPALGALKFASGMKMVACKMGTTDTTLLEISGSSTIILADNHAGVSSTQVRTGASGTTTFYVGGVASLNINTQINFAVNNVFWSQTLTAPLLFVAAKTTENPCVPLKIQGQTPWSGATSAANKVPGDVVLEVVPPAGTGTTRGRIVLRNDGQDILTVERNVVGQNRVRLNTQTVNSGLTGGSAQALSAPQGYLVLIGPGGAEIAVPYYNPNLS